MSKPFTQDQSRRAFLRRLGHLGVAGAATPLALNLAALGEASAFTASDYKALVCVFLYGGNDHNNTLIPVDTASYAAYSTIRGGAAGVALARDTLNATTLSPAVALPGGREYALAPGLLPLKPLFDSGRLAVQLNVGPLVQPTTKQQYRNRTVPLPPRLFSHNDQQSIWQSSRPEGSTVGWGGNLGDLAMANNTESLFTCISATGNAVFLSGDSALQYQTSNDGAIAINGVKNNVFGSAAVKDAMTALITGSRTHLIEEAYAAATRRSVNAEATITAALAANASSTRFTDASTNSLSAQLRLVARLIAGRSLLGAKRQVFLVSLGGFDTHDRLRQTHAALMTNVGNALRAFHDAIDDSGLAGQVTTFTASEFGRTLTYNGDGSDHGWGSHHLVLGGAVAGQRFYGTAPAIEVDGPGDVNSGRLIPTTSVDQFAATLGAWFGVSSTDLGLVVPNIGNFSQPTLGFV